MSSCKRSWRSSGSPTPFGLLAWNVTFREIAMAEENQPTTPPPGAPGGPAPAPVGNGNPANKAGVAPVPTHAAASVPLYGGNRGGKKRRDGLVPGSPEALEADRKADRDRKQQERDSKRRLAPQPALPA